MVILDTNVIIDHIRQAPGKPTYLKRIVSTNPKEMAALSLVSLQELYEGESTKDRKIEITLIKTITPLKILPYTREIAKLAGIIARDLKRPIEFPDAAIAATAILNKAELATLNKKDFREIKNLKFVDL